MANEHDLTLTRTINAPRERVWAAWTDPAQVQKWWAPNGMTCPTCEWEAKAGGKIHIVMKAGPELGPIANQEFPMTGEMKEVDAPNKLVFVGNAIMNDRVILENLTTVTLDEQDGKTNLTIKVEVTKTTPEAEGALKGMEQGWNEQTDKLVNLLEKGA